MDSVQKVELPETNDQFAKNLGKFENLNGLKENIKEGIRIEKENSESQRIRGEILEKIAKETKIEIPEVLIEAEKRRMIEDFKNLILERFKISFEDYLTKVKKTEAELLKSFSTEAEKKIKYSLVLKEMSKKEKIEVSEEEVKTAINGFLKNYPNIEKTEKEFDLEKLNSYYEEMIRQEKTLQMLESLANKL
jgi:trigger factor